jgi:hypothetical protein
MGKKKSGLVASSPWGKRKAGWLHPAHGEKEKRAGCIQPMGKRKAGWLHPAHGEKEKRAGCIQPMGKRKAGWLHPAHGEKKSRLVASSPWGWMLVASSPSHPLWCTCVLVYTYAEDAVVQPGCKFLCGTVEALLDCIVGSKEDK